jgi:phosphate transport system ATP-binding protein
METPETEDGTPTAQPAWRHRYDTTAAQIRPSGDPNPPVPALAPETDRTSTPDANQPTSKSAPNHATLDAQALESMPADHHAPKLTPTTDCVIAVRDLRVSFGDNEVLHGVDLYAPRNTVVALVGPSGCGKTTLLRTVNRLTELVPTASVNGTIELDGENIFDRGRDINLLRRRVGMVFQQPNPFPMSIFDNVAFALREQARRRPRRKDLMPKVEQALVRAGLWDEVKDHLDRSALSLSGACCEPRGDPDG